MDLKMKLLEKMIDVKLERMDKTKAKQSVSMESYGYTFAGILAFLASMSYIVGHINFTRRRKVKLSFGVLSFLERCVSYQVV